MLNLYIAAGVILALAFILLAGFVFLRNPKSVLNKLFLLFSFSVSVWLVSNYLAGDADIPENIALFSNRLVFAFGCLMTVSILLFIKKLAKRRFNFFEKLLLFFSTLLVLGSFSPFIVESIYPEEGIYLINFGWMADAYFLAILLNVVTIAVNLIKSKRSSTGVLRSQINIIQTSFLAGMFAIVITNAFLPFVFDIFWLADSGSFFSVFFVAGVGHAVLKHKLFDIRLVVARSLGYLFSIATLGAVYGFIAFSIINAFVFTDTTSTGFRQTTYTLLAIVMAFTFQSIKRFFDKLTNRLFYRDAYDSQALLDELNQVLVSNIELEKLLSKSADVIGRTVKAEFCLFEVKKTEDEPQRIIGVGKSKFSDARIEEIRSIAPRVRVKTINTDELEDDGSGLRAKLRKNDIAVLVRLTDAPEKPVEGLGHIILGFKKSGNPYSSQDTRILEIIADELVIAIQNALRFEEIQNFNITLQQKVDDATRKLRKANDKLIALDQTKDDFISMASHQLRTPLTSVKGYVSMVLEGDVGKVSRKQKDLLNQAYVSSQRMVYLISDLLNVSRLRTGKFVIDPRPTNLAEVVGSEIAQLTETAKARKLELEYHRPKEFPKLNLDETKIRQVIMNFVDNAIYYTPAGGHIDVVVEDKDESIEFRVEDNGLGVPKSEQHHLFTKFYRAKNAKKARPDGTGLGLFMAKKVIVAQGGAVIFSSKENKGSTFGFSFPKAKLASDK